jgi:hypothetical protein
MVIVMIGGSMVAKKKLALVVHGIGEQEAGETLAQLVGGVAGDRPHTVTTDTRMFRDIHPNTDDRAIDLFPCHIHRVTTRGSKVIFAEVFWADTSRSMRGRVGTLYELVKTILGLGYIVRENAAEKHPNPEGWNKSYPASWIRRAANLFVSVLHGPILATNIVNALILIWLYAVGWLPWINKLAFLQNFELQVHVAVFLTGVSAVFLWFILRKGQHGRLFGVFVYWMGVAGLLIFLSLAIYFLGAFSALKPAGCEDTKLCAFFWFTSAFPMAQMLAWVSAIVLVTFILIAQVVDDYCNKKDHWRNLFPVTCSAMMILFMVVAVILFIAFLTFLEQLPKGDTIFTNETIQILKYVTASLSLPAWVGLGLLIVAGIVLAIYRAIKIAEIRRKLKTLTFGTQDCETYLKSLEIPRLIVNPIVNFALALGIASFLIGAVILVLMVDLELGNHGNHNVCTSGEIEDQLSTIANLQCSGLSISIGVSAISIAIFASFWGVLSIGLGVAKDIAGYFSEEPNRKQGNEMQPVLRQRINNRLHTVASNLVAAENPDEIVIIAHSQGTVVAVEALRDGLFDQFLSTTKQKKLSLVTMGSPVGHIYSHYFPTRFKLIDHMKGKIAGWTNIYRIDDFVGTDIGGADGDWPVNRPVGPKGHTGYWADDQVRSILEETVLEELKPSA